jgi:phosphoglycolate phosphatase-like HAD superfamily hydrolase
VTRHARTLLMDLDGVIRHWPGHGRTRAEQAAGLPAGAIRRHGYGMEFTLANLGVFTHEQWLARVCALLVEEYGQPAGEAVPVWDDDPGELDQEMVTLLRRVHHGGTAIGLLSNNTTALRRDLDRHGLTDLFTAVVTRPKSRSAFTRTPRCGCPVARPPSTSVGSSRSRGRAGGHARCAALRSRTVSMRRSSPMQLPCLKSKPLASWL